MQGEHCSHGDPITATPFIVMHTSRQRLLSRDICSCQSTDAAADSVACREIARAHTHTHARVLAPSVRRQVYDAGAAPLWSCCARGQAREGEETERGRGLQPTVAPPPPG